MTFAIIRVAFRMTWRATVLTLFPEMFPGPLGVSLAGKALASGLWALEARDIRDSATDRHRSVDDTPAGGGPGMVLRADVLADAIDAADVASVRPKDRPRLLMSPRGRAIDPVPNRGTRRRARPLVRLRPL
jgi:tRNA (guanine37-N1)-methyltransferase